MRCHELMAFFIPKEKYGDFDQCRCRHQLLSWAPKTVESVELCNRTLRNGHIVSCLFVCSFVCVRYDCHSALHCTVHWIYCTAKLWFGSSLVQDTRNSTDAVRRCTVTDRLAWVKTRSWLILHCLVDLKVNLTLRMVAELPGSYCAWRLQRWKSRTVPHCLRWKSRTVPHCNSQ